MVKFWKLYESENSENLARWSLSYSLFQHSKVTALEVLQDDGKYISKETSEKLIFQKKHFKKLITLYFSFEQKLVHVFLLMSCQRHWKNASEREIYGLQYIERYVMLQLYKKLRISKAKTTTNQFILSKKSFRQSEVLMNVKVRRKIHNY